MRNGSNEERPVQKMGNKVWHTVLGLLSVVACMLLLLHEALFTDKCVRISATCSLTMLTCQYQAFQIGHISVYVRVSTHVCDLHCFLHSRCLYVAHLLTCLVGTCVYIFSYI